jgi:type IV pilus assembly protein PilY1
MATPVPGRDLVIARLDTGEILRVFTRLPEVQTAFPTDTLLAASRITDVPFDSPIIGAPMIYPADVGTDTTRIFVGDADGTLWRIDVSDPNPTNWTGAMYLDAYNQTVDTSATAWSDGEPFGVPPTLSLNGAGQLVIDAATTTTDTFDTNGIYFVYSITEAVDPASSAYHAVVNWYLGPPTPPSTTTTFPDPTLALPPSFLAGERVSGPMTVFNGELFFATFAAGVPTPSGTCNQGNGRIFGVDYQVAYAAASPGSGGNPLMTPLGPPPPSVVAYVVPTGLGGVVIPGVSIRATPACASQGTGGVNPLGGGSYNSIGASTPASFSLFAQLGQQNPTGPGANTLNIPLNTPIVPMRIDSWAGVFE